MKAKPKASSILFRWRKYLSKNARRSQPKEVTVEWLKQNRWWWRNVETSIAQQVEEDFPADASQQSRSKAAELRTWNDVKASAFVYELGRRFQRRKSRNWLELPDVEIHQLARDWPDKHSTAGHDTPLVCRRFDGHAEWYFEPVATCRDLRTGEVLWNRNEPAWTEPHVFAVNLNVGDRAIADQFREWLAEQRGQTGIPSPRGGSTQSMGAKTWRFIEAVDKKQSGLACDEIENSCCSKAESLWDALKNPASCYSRPFYLRVALRDIPKHGHILPGSLPPVPTLTR